MKPKLCILRFDYYPQENHVRRNAEALREAGYDVDVVCLKHKGQRRTEAVNGVVVHRLPLTRRRGNTARYLFEYAAFFILSSFALTRLFLRKRFDCIEIDSMPEFLVFAALVPKIFGAKLVLYIFDNMPEIFSYDYRVPMGHPMIRFMKWVERRSVRFAHRIIVTHTDARDVLVRHGVPATRFDVVLNVPDESIFTTPDHRVRDDDSYLLVSHGSQLRRYGYDTLVRAVSILDGRIPELKVLLIGGGKHRPDLISLAQTLGVNDRFDFLPWIPFEDVPGVIAASDVAVVPILLELALPNKLFEYAALNVPVIMSDLNTVRAYYDDTCVRYFPPGDAPALADAITELYENPARRTQLADNARRVYGTEHRWEIMKRVYLGIYERLVGGGS